MRVLAIDASLRNCGVAVVDGENGKSRALFFGTIHNATSLKSSACLVAIRDRLAKLIRQHQPDCCAMEAVIYVQSYKTAILLGAARGAAILAAAESGLPVFEYAPTRIKQSTVGRGAAGKNQVAFMVRALLRLTETPDADSADALALQEEIVTQKRRDSTIADTILFLEHDAVFTIGRTPDQASLRGASHLPHPLFQTNRGGQATYHGPGQLMGYPIIDLSRCGQDLHKYLRWIEDLLIGFLAKFELSATRRTGLTGVWIDDRKIASIGVGVRHWITMHGFALNICGDLAPFTQITP